MEPFSPRNKNGPEFWIQDKWCKFLKAKQWNVERLVGNMYQSGIPDIFIAHKEHGQRFIDIKVYGKYNFTPAQRIKWPLWHEYGIGIWILGAESKEACTKEHMIKEYPKLFLPPNWREFWNTKWDKKFNIDALIEDVEDEANRK